MSACERAVAALDALARRPIDNTPPNAGRRLRRLLDAADAPDRGMQIAVIVGTCGKGSTAACLAAILRACGERVGTHTGPHLSDWTERIAVDGRRIGRERWGRAVEDVLARARALFGSSPGPADRVSVVEVMATVALEFFRDRGVRWAVMEAGVGGARDHTMALDPEITLMTRVDLDHVHLLGRTLHDIAAEKGGVIRPGVSHVSAAQSDDARRVIEARATAVGAPFWLGGRDFTARVRPGAGTTGNQFDFSLPALDVHWEEVRLSLMGRHQVENAATALAAALRIWTHGRVLLSEEKVRKALRSVHVAGRFERLMRVPEVVIDGAHQPAGARALRQTVDDVYGSRPVFLVLGALGDRDRDGMAEPLVARAARAWFTLPPWEERAGGVAALQQWAARWPGAVAVADWREACRLAMEAARGVEGAVVLITGSLYLIGQVRATVGGGAWRNGREIRTEG